MSPRVSIPFFLSCLLVLSSCSVKQVALPDYKGVQIRDILASRESISSIETIFSIVLTRDNSDMSGDGKLTIRKNGDLSMRVYSFGFLAFEMVAENGIITSNPPIDATRAVLLSSGLRDCLYWWDLGDANVDEDDRMIVLSNGNRSLWIEKKTMLPARQTIALDDGRELLITYDHPREEDGTWYPSLIRIELNRSVVTLSIKEISFTRGSTQDRSKPS